MKKLKVLMVMDLTAPSDDQDFSEELHRPDWKTEKEISTALLKLGHKVAMVGLYDNITPLLNAVKRIQPDIIFNSAESFNNNTSQERNIVGLIEMLGIPFTGSSPTGLMLCKNKGLMKKLLSFHHIKSPKFSVSYRGKKFKKPAHLKYPLIVKPDKEDASYGISQQSFVENDNALKDRVEFLHENLGQNALIEEYVEGREMYVGVMGIDRLRVFTPRELVFNNVPDDEPKFATYKAKWDQEYKDRWGIRWRFAAPMASGILERMERICKRVYRVLHIHGYGRIDLRITPNNEIMIIEANPNPAIGRDEDLAMSAEKDGLPYDQLIQKILQYGLKYHSRKQS